MLGKPKPPNTDIGDKPAQFPVPEAKRRKSFHAPNHLKHHSGSQRQAVQHWFEALRQVVNVLSHTSAIEATRPRLRARSSEVETRL